MRTENALSTKRFPKSTLPVVVLLLLCLTSIAPVANAADEIDLRLRLLWGGGVSRTYAGSIRIDRGGSFADPSNLSMQIDAPGTIRLVASNEIEMRPAKPANFGGLDVKVVGEKSNRILIRFDDSTTGKSLEKSFTLEELVAGPSSTPIDDQGNHLLIDRHPGDRIRIQHELPHFVFRPGDPVPLRIEGYHTSLPEQSQCRVTVKLLRESDQLTLQTETLNITTDQVGSFHAVALPTLYAPDVQGVYRVDIGVEPRSLLSSLVTLSHREHRSLQFVVVAHRSEASDLDEWQSILRWPDQKAAWWDRLRKRPRWQDMRAFGGPGLRRTRRDSRSEPGQNGTEVQTVLALAPNETYLVPIKVTLPGTPHAATIRFSSQEPLRLGVSILETNVSQQLLPLSLDSGIDYRPTVLSQNDSAFEHRVVFWPRRNEVGLLLTNLDPQNSAHILQYEISVGPKTLASRNEPLEFNSPGEKNAVDGASANDRTPVSNDRRFVAIYLDKPLIPEAFGGLDTADPTTGRSLDDWQTFLTASEHLVQYLKWSGRNGLICFVAGEGGSLLPQAVEQSTDKFDGGTFFSDARDPMKKDVAELLLRLFEDHQLRLSLGMHFDAPFPEVESAGIANEEIQLIDHEGRRWNATPRSESIDRAFRYNPQHPSVQAAIEKRIEAMLQRYGDDAAFHGITLEIGGAEQLGYPGDLWGYDPTSIQGYVDSKQGRFPIEFSEKRNTIYDHARLEFLQWRATKQSSFLVKLAGLIQRKNPSAKLFLSLAGLAKDPPSSADFADPNAAIEDPNYVALARGIDLQLLSQTSGIVLIEPNLKNRLQTLTNRRWSRYVHERLNVPTSPDGVERGILLGNSPRGRRWPSVEEQLPLGAKEIQAWTFPQIQPPGSEARAAIANDLLRVDATVIAEGGWTPNFGQEEETVDLLRTLSLLPKEPFIEIRNRLASIVSTEVGGTEVTAENSDSSLFKIRTSSNATTTTFQLINAAPWAMSVNLNVQATRKSVSPKWLAIAPARSENFTITPNAWTVQIEPYEILAVTVEDPDFSIVGWRTSPDPAAITYVQEEVLDLSNRIKRLHASQLQPLPTFQNGSFELLEPSGLPKNWTFSSLPTASIAAVDDAVQGKKSLRVQSTDGNTSPVWIQSDPIPVPATGRLAVELWVRRPPGSLEPRVRVAVQGRRPNGARYERSRWLGSNTPDAPIPEQWDKSPLVLLVSDLPTAGLEDLRIAIDLASPGEILIDEVRVYDLYLHPDERIKLRNELFVANEQLRLSPDKINLPVIERFLRSEWADYLREYVALPERVAAP